MRGKGPGVVDWLVMTCDSDYIDRGVWGGDSGIPDSGAPAIRFSVDCQLLSLRTILKLCPFVTLPINHERSVKSHSKVVVQKMSRLVISTERICFLLLQWWYAPFYHCWKVSRNWMVGSIIRCHEENIQRDDCDERFESSLDLRRKQFLK